jgi:hypothetical protein
VPAGRSGAGSYNAASSRSRVLDRHRLAQPCRVGQQLQGRVGRVSDDDQRAVGEPAPELADHLAAPVGERLVTPAALPVVAFGRCQHRQERQGPDAPGPGDRRQELHRDPAQAAGLDKVRFARPHRIPIDAFGGDLGAAAPLDGLIQAHDNRVVRRQEGPHQHPEPDPAQGPAGPSGAVEHAVIILKLPLAAQAQHPQDRGDGPLARRQNGAEEQDLGPLPHPVAEDRRKGAHDAYNGRRQGTQGAPPLGRGVCAKRTLPSSARRPNGQSRAESVSFTDCMVMATADHYGTRLIFGFDEVFRKNGYVMQEEAEAA